MQSFRPLYGVSLFLLISRTMSHASHLAFSSPLRGISISTKSDSSGCETGAGVFVPSTGYLYFYGQNKKERIKSSPFSSPLRGISISTHLHCICIFVFCFRPLYGVSLFLHRQKNWNNWLWRVFVPSTGYLYFYGCKAELKQNGFRCFRPLYGVSLFLLQANALKAFGFVFSSPLRGISISTQYSILLHRQKLFSSPLRGISISTSYEGLIIKAETSFRPLYGVSLFLLYMMDTL